MPKVIDLASNRDSLALRDNLPYAAILGESPSKGAKSPTLWNAAFESLELPMRMHPIDVQPKQLDAMIGALREDTRYIGGAVTLPFKQAIIPSLDELEPEADLIGAVNCIYRVDGKLIGCNTDGAGALHSLHAKLGDLSDKTVLLVGTGGAGYAVAVYLAKAIGKGGHLILCNRSMAKTSPLAEKVAALSQVSCTDFSNLDKFLPAVNIVVNCSSVGFENWRSEDRGSYSLAPFVPLDQVTVEERVEGKSAARTYLSKIAGDISRNHQSALARMTKLASDTYIFDIVYQPLTTPLLMMANWLGMAHQNGAAMNLEQAVIAFVKVCERSGLAKSLNHEVIRQRMRVHW